MAFESFKAWIIERRSEIEAELEALESLATPRTELLTGTVRRISDRATEIAGAVTDKDGAKPKLEAIVSAMLEAAFPQGLPEGSPVSGNNSANLFLSDALVLLGMALKTDPGQAVRAFLKAPIESLSQLVATGLESTNNLLAVLLEIESEPIGQGISLPAGDARLSSMLLGLGQAQDGIERILANLSGQQPVNPLLSQQVQSFLKSATTALVQNTGNVDRLSLKTETLVGELLSKVQETETQIQKLRANLTTFRESYTANTTGLYADRAQVSALLSEVVKLQETVTAVQGAYPELESFRAAWLDSLFALQALTWEARTETAKNIFEEDTALRTDYEDLLAELAPIPSTDLSGLSVDMLSLRSLLLGTNTLSSLQDQYDMTLTRVRSLLYIYVNRLGVLQKALATYPIGLSPLLEKLLDIVRDSKMKAAEDALLKGDVAAFFNLAVGALNPVDGISSEVHAFLVDNTGLPDTLSKDLSDSLNLVIEFENADIQASQGFESSRKSAIDMLQTDLINLNRLESVLLKAESQGA